MRIFKKIIIFISFFVLSVPLFAATLPELFKEANQLYVSGKYKDAAAIYEKISSEKKLPEIFYNLGNAYFKNKEIGLAILNYEKAFKLKPRDKDVRTNLSYVNQLIEYKVEDKRNWLSKWQSKLVSYFTFDELWLLALSSYFIFISALLVLLLTKKRLVFGKLTVTLLTLFLLCSLPLILKFTETGRDGEAVVTVKQSEVRYGPSTVDRIAFRLVEGLKIVVHDHKQDWYRIGLKDGRSGWIPESDVQLI